MAAAGRQAWLLALFIVGGCDCLGRGGLDVHGPTPYVRCLAADPPVDRRTDVGSRKLVIEDRELRIEGLGATLRLAVCSGPAFGPAPDASVLARVSDAKPDLVLVLGGLGDDAVTAKATLRALAALPVPVLFVAGGRDTPERIAAAFAAVPEAAGRVVDATALGAVRLGSEVLIPIAGASEGRYAIDERGCGFGLGDLKEVASTLGQAPKGERRWIVAWEAPGHGGALSVARTEGGVDVGSSDLAELARRIGARGGLFAWPEVQLLRPRAGDGTRAVPIGVAAPDLRVVAPRLTGPATERADGSRVLAGFLLARFDASGLAVESVHAIENSSAHKWFRHESRPVR